MLEPRALRRAVGSPTTKPFAVEARIDLVTSTEGRQYLQATQGNRAGYIPFHQIGTPRVLDMLANQGIVITGQQRKMNFLYDLVHLTPSDMVVADVEGWNGCGGSGNGCSLTNGDGTVFFPAGQPRVRATFKRQPPRFVCQGSLEAWQDLIKTLDGNNVCVFVLCATFAAPLLRFAPDPRNFGLQLTGPSGCGKSAILGMAAAVCGSPAHGSHSPYPMSLGGVLGSIDEAIASHADMPLIVDDVNVQVAGEAEAKQTSICKKIIVRFAEGRVDARPEGRHARNSRLVYIIAGREPLSEVLGTESSLVSTVDDHLITLRLNGLRYGCFDRLPEGQQSGSAFARYLIGGLSEHHGVPMAKFVQYLVDAVHRDDAKLRVRIRSLMASFRKSTGVDENDGAAARLVDRIGLVYAAGCIAQQADVLPREFDCAAAALACFRLHLTGSGAVLPFSLRLADLVTHADTLHIGKGQKVTRQAVNRASVFVKHSGSGTELLIRKEHVHTVFPDWRTLRRQSEVRSVWERRGGHRSISRRLCPGADGVEVVCFRLPDAQKQCTK